MAIVQTIDNAYQLEQAFEAAGRGNNFTYKGLKILYDYLDNLADETGENIELDIVALCCEYSESTLDEIISDYSVDIDLGIVDGPEEIEEVKRNIVRDFLGERTSVCGETDEGFVYACF